MSGGSVSLTNLWKDLCEHSEDEPALFRIGWSLSWSFTFVQIPCHSSYHKLSGGRVHGSQGSRAEPHECFPVLGQLSSTWVWAGTGLSDPRRFLPPCFSGSLFYRKAQHKLSLELFQR